MISEGILICQKAFWSLEYKKLMTPCGGGKKLQKGEKPGKGVYRCTYCWYDIELKSDEQALSRCPVCGGIHFF